MLHSNKTLPAFRAIALISSMLLLGHAQAHHVWLEQDGNQAKLYFGEFADNLKEASPGRLDRFGKPSAQKISSTGAVPVAVVKTADGFTLAGAVAQGESLVAEDAAYPIADRKDGDKSYRSLYVPAARLVADGSQQMARLTLDLVPTGQQGGKGMQVQAIYKGQPLAKAKVALMTGSGWSKELRTDDDGKLSLSLPWKGSYVLELKHADGAGERAGEKYDRASYVTSLTVMQSDGLAPLPPAPVTAPSKMN